MPLTTGSRLSHYEILSALGAGGMGEVYKARDTRLDRIVAIKVLPEQFATDADRRERFEREARAVAALNHPHICDLHDVGEADGVRFLVMEHLEGQTLEERLLRGRLPIAEALRVAIDLADALDHAHRRGLVHRDLKPGNVMLTKPGAKLLDFGLSRLQAKADLLAMATVTADRAPVTAEGTVLGTYPYMAPEQLAGREADARSDIFGFGAVLYEAIAGRRAFEGATAATLIGAILHTAPPALSSRQPLAPVGLDRLVSRCLAKDPDDRWQTARDLMLELKWIAEQAGPAAVSTTSRGRRVPLASLAAGVLLAIAVAGLTVVYIGRAARKSAGDSAAMLTFAPPEGVAVADLRAGGPITISPDGQRLAFVGSGPDGKQMIWIRPIDTLDSQPLTGTDGGAYPFWSPDSQSIGFFAQGKLKRIRLPGGPVQTVCTAVQPRGGTWSRDGVIVFAAATGYELFRVPADGGLPSPIAADGLNQERLWPSFLPDGRHFVYFGRTQREGVFLANLDAAGASPLLDGYASIAVAPGLLLGMSGAGEAGARHLTAFPFDASRLEITGPPVPVPIQVDYRSGQGLASFSVSENGTLVYTNQKASSTELTWFDRSGKKLGQVGGSIVFRQPSLSADEKTIAVVRNDPETPGEDLWLIDAEREIPRRFTFYGDRNFMPTWSPDGRWLVFSSARRSPPNLFLKSLDAAGDEQRLLESAMNNQPTDWSPDGRYVVYASLHPSNGWDLMLQPMSRTGDPDGKPEPLLVTRYDEHLARVSPDGRWLAYMSDESGTFEVYLRPFHRPGVGRRVSDSGGTAPRWRQDGRELFYLSLDGQLMAVSLLPGDDLKTGTPIELFKTRIADRGVSEPLRSPLRANFAVDHDGRRFLIDTVIDEPPPSSATVVINWLAAVRNN